MTQSEKEPLSFPPVEPPPFPAAAKPTLTRRKLAALVGVLPLGALVGGAAFLASNDDDTRAAAARGSATPTTPAEATTPGTISTQTAPPPGLAPEISKIGSRHILALHTIHLYINHMGNYDPQSLDPYFAGAIDATTGACRQQLIDTENATREYFIATNSRSQVIEFNCGLRAITGGTALGIGYVKQSISSTLTPVPMVSLAATVVTAEEQPDGRWLISDSKRITT